MNGVKVLSAMENIPDSPENIILESLLEGMNQYYSAELSQKVKRGMYETRRKGHYQGGWIPYGYKVDGRKIIIDEDRAAVVRYMFEQYSIGTYVSTIIANLTAQGILYKRKPFLKNTVYGILKNEKDSGAYHQGEEVIDNMYPQIIPQPLFDIVRKKVEKNHYGKRSVQAVYLFRNKITCAYCGHPVSAETGTARGGEVIRYYKCHGKKRYRNGCELRMIRKDYLEELLREQDRQSVENTRLATLQREKVKIEKALENLAAALEQSIISATANKRLHEQQTELKRDILIEQSKCVTKIPESVIREFYTEALKMEAVMLVNYLIREIVLYNDKIEIYFHTPLKNGPDDNRGCSFYLGYGLLPYASYRKDSPNTENMQIEMFA